ncbi:low temperature requirement protein A [Ochrobactrum quorumnocens]|uniref:low temperature requirement protein A n=1 Tax=Ochrobactrum quorumnocens TaxID=271865 RepID=UPI003855132E
MNHKPNSAGPLGSGLKRMTGRDPAQFHRVASPLELLFDLTFVIAFGQAASQLAHGLAEGHYLAALIGFGFSSFAICWAWINFTWFASAFDTDDWLYRIVTMIQMIGVLILAVGIPRMFASIEQGAHLDNSMMVSGYVVMRFAMIFQWLRAAKQGGNRSRACRAYVVAISVAQIGWIAQILFDFSLPVSLLLGVVLAGIELSGPYFAERIGGGTPWHPHHIAERYSLFAIIALGEGIVGTVATLSAVIDNQGFSLDVGLVGLAGMGLTFGMWWIYYLLPSAEALEKSRQKSFLWGYGHMAIIAAIVATGAGLHVAANFIEHKAHIGPAATLLTVAIPLIVFIAGLYALNSYLIGTVDRLHGWLLLATIGVVIMAVLASQAGLPMPVCLVLLSLAPAVSVIGHELSGDHRRVVDAR